jgi:hypothetical protein
MQCRRGPEAGRGPPTFGGDGYDGGGEGGNDGAGSSTSHSPVESDPSNTAALPSSWRILDRSVGISQREDDLARALVVTVIDGWADSISSSIAHQFEILESSLALHPLGLERFLLILPNIELMVRVLNGGRALVTPDLRLHVMSWTRFLHSSACFLPVTVEIDLEGIPAHASDFATTQLLLSDHCSISSLHPLNENH